MRQGYIADKHNEKTSSKIIYAGKQTSQMKIGAKYMAVLWSKATPVKTNNVNLLP